MFTSGRFEYNTKFVRITFLRSEHEIVDDVRPLYVLYMYGFAVIQYLI